MNWLDTITALDTHVNELGLIEKVVYDNVKYSPTAGTPYVRVLHQPVDTEPVTVGTSGVMEVTGVVIIGVNYPAGSGSGAALRTADAIAQGFKPGVTISAGGGTVVIRKATIGSARPQQDVDFFCVPVVVFYSAYHSF